MANRPAPALALRDGDRERLREWIEGATATAGLARRARILLLAADGVANARIADALGVSVPTVLSWRRRYRAQGLAGLTDEPRPGRPPSLDHLAIIAETLRPPPASLGATLWSSRLLASQLGVSPATVARAWRSHGVRPWREGAFRFDTEPPLIGRVSGILGVYLAPPGQHMIALRVEQTAPGEASPRADPESRGTRRRAPHTRSRVDPDRSGDGGGGDGGGAATVLGTLEAAARAGMRHHRSTRGLQDFLEALTPVEPPAVVCLVTDSPSLAHSAAVATWLETNQGTAVHMTSSRGKWIALVETWFTGLAAPQGAGDRNPGADPSVLSTQVRSLLDGWTRQSRSFTWTGLIQEEPSRHGQPTQP